MPDGGFQTEGPIALVGLMGAGKSAVGSLLANRLDRVFVDTDVEVEHLSKMPIAEIFQRFGERGFREREQKVAEGLDFSRPLVIATGGGLFVNDSVRKRLLENCITIWLDVPVPLLVSRLSAKTDRPLLGSDPLRSLEKLADQRRSAYAQAHLRIEGALPPEEVVDRLLIALNGPRP